MKKFIYGFILGVVATILFFYLGGSELFMSSLGRGTTKVEKELQKSGEVVKEKVHEIKK